MIKLNGIRLDFTQFPNGETLVDGEQIQAFLSPAINVIGFYFQSDLDLIRLMFVKKYLDDHCGAKCNLNLYYMPYSRMDRSETHSTVFTLKYVADFINNLLFDSITLYEPHSDVAPALLDRCEVIYPTIYGFGNNESLLRTAIKDTGFDQNSDYLFFPDAGAQKRYGSKLSGFKELVGFKHRDFATGKIMGLKVVGDQDLRGKKIIIVDDLCSRGGTFMFSGHQLKDMGAEEIYLVVGHCENTIMQGDIVKTDIIDKVYTTDSILSVFMPKIKVFEV